MQATPYENLKNNNNIKEEKNIQNLIKEIEELKDYDKSNDRIDGVFSETKEGQELTKNLNKGLSDALQENQDASEIIADEINRLLDDPNIQLSDDVKDGLIILDSLIKGTRKDSSEGSGKDTSKDSSKDSSIIDKSETIKDSLINFEDLKSLTLDDIKSLFDGNGYNKIKDNLITEEDGKQYINLKGKRIKIGNKDEALYDYKDSNVIIPSGRALYLGNNDNMMTIYRDKVEISTDEGSETRLPNGEQVLITNNPDKSMTWSSHGINVKVEGPDNGKYHLYTKDNSKLDLGMYGTDEAFCSIAKILSSKQNNPGEKCKVLDDHTIQCGDTSTEIQTADLEEITKWINNFN